MKDDKPEAALEDLRARGNDLILGKSARPTTEDSKHFERAHAYWYFRDLKDWKAEQERQRLIDAGIILPDIPDESDKNAGRKFVKPQMTEDERLALEMQAKMSKFNAESANERNNAGGGSGYKPGSRRKFNHGNAPKSDEEIAAEMQNAKDKITELEGNKEAEKAAAEKAEEEKIIAEAQAANAAKKEKPAEAAFLMTESEIQANWGFLKNIVNIDRFFDSGVKA